MTRQFFAAGFSPMPLAGAFAAALALLVAAPAVFAGNDVDRGEGYYYPKVGSEEVFTRKLISGPVADRNTRAAFVTLITKAMLDAPEKPPYAIFAKGSRAQRLILTGLDDQMFRTLFRARAVMAQLSASMRGAPFFKDQGLAATGTFYDMLQLLGFKSLTITDGVSWAHRVKFE